MRRHQKPCGQRLSHVSPAESFLRTMAIPCVASRNPADNGCLMSRQQEASCGQWLYPSIISLWICNGCPPEELLTYNGYPLQKLPVDVSTRSFLRTKADHPYPPTGRSSLRTKTIPPNRSFLRTKTVRQQELLS